MSRTVIKDANLALALFLELGVLASLGYWGVYTGQGTLAKIGLAVGAPVVAIIVWAMFGAPKARWHLNGPWRLILQVVFFGAAAIALLAAGQPVLGGVFALLFVLNVMLLYALGQ